MENVSAMTKQAAAAQVAVVIVNWNGARFLERCLASLMRQTRMPSQIILVDNASTDESLAIVRRFPVVRLLALDSNTGFARANNIAIESVADGTEWVALLNPDAFAEPEWLEQLLAAAQRHPGYAMFSSKMLDAADTSRLDGIGDAYHISGRVWRRGHGAPNGREAQQECEVFSPCAAAALYRRSALQEAGGFDEGFFCYVEDVDLGFRLRLLGYGCLYVPESAVLHIGSATTGGQQSDFATYHGHRNLVWCYIKNMPGLLFWLLLPLHLMMNLAGLIMCTLRGQGRVILRAKRDALAGLPAMWRKRRIVQAMRKASLESIWRQMDRSVL
jgi:GT2 family glycosyltransferase